MRPTSATFSYPTKEEKNQSVRFRTYVNYFAALSQYLESTYASPGELVSRITENTTFEKIQGGKCANPSLLKKLLWNSWFTELQLHISAPPNELIPYNNHWAPVQLYYTLYLAIRAYFISSGQNVSNKHASTLTTINNEIHNRSYLFPDPWRIQCSGDFQKRSITYSNLPANIQIQSISSLSQSENVEFHDSFCMFLRTTRKRQIKNKIVQWKSDNNRKRIKSTERLQLTNNVSPTSIFDAIYRLRIRSNYQDADSILLTLDLPNIAKQYNYGLRSVSWYSLLALETIIAKYLGRKYYEQIVKEFICYDLGKVSENLVQKRWGIIENEFKKVSA